MASLKDGLAPVEPNGSEKARPKPVTRCSASSANVARMQVRCSRAPRFLLPASSSQQAFFGNLVDEVTAASSRSRPDFGHPLLSEYLLDDRSLGPRQELQELLKALPVGLKGLTPSDS